MNEEWRIIPNTNGIYEISSLGRLKTYNWKNTGRERIMNPAYDAKGYLRTVIILNGNNKTVKLHRLVAESFIDNPENKPQVNHINGVKDDNRVINLEWCTNKENAHHALKNGLFTKPRYGEDNPTSILTDRKVRFIRTFTSLTRNQMAELLNIKPSLVKDVRLRRTWKHI